MTRFINHQNRVVDCQITVYPVILAMIFFFAFFAIPVKSHDIEYANILSCTIFRKKLFKLTNAKKNTTYFPHLRKIL